MGMKSPFPSKILNDNHDNDNHDMHVWATSFFMPFGAENLLKNNGL